MNEHLENHAQYDQTEFGEVNLAGETLEQAEFYDCVFVKCNLSSAVLTGCRFENCRFENCDMSNARLTDCTLINTCFESCKLLGINWTKVRRITGELTVSNSVLSYGVFGGMKVKLRLKNCTARDVDFSEADISGSVFEETDLIRSVFARTNLSKADLSTAHGYSINANMNNIKKTVFSLPEAVSLLDTFDIVIK